MRDGIDTVLPGQFDRTLPQRLRQLRPPRLGAAKLIQLALQLGDWLGNGYAFAVHNQPPPGRLNEVNRLGHFAARTLAGNSRCIREGAVQRARPRPRVRLSEAQAYLARKSVTNLMVACGFSSMIQCPELGTMPPVTWLAPNRISSAIPLPKNFSAPMANTGIVILPPVASNALLSVASWLNAPNCSKASCIACGRAYRAA